MKSRHEVYAILKVSNECQDHITHILSFECGVSAKAIVRNMHLTVYYSRRLLPGLEQCQQDVNVVADAAETRFMVMAPGGENPRPDLEPSRRSIGIRLTRRNQAFNEIQSLRSTFYAYETENVLGRRNPSTAKRNAFGARHYQPHVTLLRPGSLVEPDLSELGATFRSACDWIEFDRFCVAIRCG